MARASIIYSSVKEWKAQGEKLFGKDPEKWKFRCPSCGNIQTAEDFLKHHVPKKTTMDVFYYNCIGRHMENAKGTIFNDISPCNYTSGGLFQLGDFIEDKNKKIPVLPFVLEEKTN